MYRRPRAATRPEVDSFTVLIDKRTAPRFTPQREADDNGLSAVAGQTHSESVIKPSSPERCCHHSLSTNFFYRPKLEGTLIGYPTGRPPIFTKWETFRLAGVVRGDPHALSRLPSLFSVRPGFGRSPIAFYPFAAPAVISVTWTGSQPITPTRRSAPRGLYYYQPQEDVNPLHHQFRLSS